MSNNYSSVFEEDSIEASGWMLNQEVAQLVEKWGSETTYFSSPDQIRDHPAYAQLKDMGLAATNAILRAYRFSNAPVDILLQDLYGWTPVPKSSWGNASQARRAWIEWGVSHELEARPNFLFLLSARPATA